MKEKEIFDLLLKTEGGYKPNSQEKEYLSKIKYLSIRLTMTSMIGSISNTYSITDAQEVDLGGYDKEKILNCIHYLEKLEILDLRSSLIEIFPKGIEKLKELRELDLSYTKITYIPESIKELRNLRRLNLRFTEINSLPISIGKLENLTVLDLSRTKIEYLPRNIGGLKKLRLLNLNESSLKALPSSIDALISLRTLGLCYLVLDSLPVEILNLDLKFRDDFPQSIFYSGDSAYNKARRYLDDDPSLDTVSNIRDDIYPKNIFIHGTQIKGIPPEILIKDRALIREYLALSGDKEPINECKVVFLGDGGAGKSLIIHRLLNDGLILDDFAGDATPGIDICSKEYYIAPKNIEAPNIIDLHFWDFGGQAIMYSMHRMFLTNRTLYVVVLNVREDRQNEQAMFWVRNIRSFAKYAPILIIANHIDENKYAKVRINRIREKYNNIVDVEYGSALKDSPSTFLEKIKDTIIDTVLSMETPYTELPKPWIKLINSVRNMPENYITSDVFYQKCFNHGISMSEEVLDNLIDWYQDLGVCFYSKKHPTSKKYMVLKPFWMLNALYLLIVNGRGYARNGFLHENDIYYLIKQAGSDENIKCVSSEIEYADDEIQYIINVVINFDLMYRVDNTTFFIPMLCDEYEEDLLKSFIRSDTVHIFYKYSYLPENVLHRYMVRKGSEIRPEYAWRTAAFFERSRCGWEAFLRSEENSLDIYVNANKTETHPVNAYIDIIRDSIIRINSELGIEADEFITYKEHWGEDTFETEYLFGCLENGIDKIYSKVFNRSLYIKEILRVVDNPDRALTTEVIKQLCSILSEMSERCVFLCSRGEVELTTDFQSAISPVLNQKYDIQVSREYTIGRAKKQIGESDLFFFRYKDGIKQNLYILENKYINKFEAQYKQLMGYLNPSFLAGITLSINKDKGWEESFDIICEALEKIKSMRTDYSPIDIERKTNHKNTIYVKSQHIIPETGETMPVYHLVLNISDKTRQEVAWRARK